MSLPGNIFIVGKFNGKQVCVCFLVGDEGGRVGGMLDFDLTMKPSVFFNTHKTKWTSTSNKDSFLLVSVHLAL